LTWQPLNHNLNVSLGLSKKVSVFIELGRQQNSIEANCVNRDFVEGPATTRVGEGRRGGGVCHLMARSHVT
jgi:hypothetical protein